MADPVVEQTRALLKKDVGGKNLYDHVVQILAKISHDKPDNAYDVFESLSRYLKESTIAAQQSPDKAEKLSEDPLFKELQSKWLKTTPVLTEVPKNGDDPVTVTGLPDWMADSQMFEWAGVGFSKTETYEIHCSLRKLAASTEGIKSLRFWGKILGTEADYLIAEGQIDGNEEGKDEDVEPRGQGANKYAYWVANAPMTGWTILPDVAPKEVVAVRQLKHMLTGDLTRPVITHPYFPGTEKQYLRALIALITSETTICPAGYYRPTEDGSGIEKTPDPDYTWPDAGALGASEGWIHFRDHILKIGKCKYPEVNAEEEPEKAAAIDAQKEADPPMDSLRGLDTDPPLGEEQPAWSVKQFGDLTTYTIEDNATSYAVTAVRSLRWPGALTCIQGKKFASLYVGYGFRAGVPAFFPVAPGDIQDEPEEGDEQPEPHPLEQDTGSDGGDVDEKAGDQPADGGDGN